MVGFKIRTKADDIVSCRKYPGLGQAGPQVDESEGANHNAVLQDTEHPGYRHIIIDPQVTRDLTSVSATVGSVRGNVTSSWSHEPGVITLHVDIPVNSTATVSIPQDPEMTDITVHEGGQIVWEKGAFMADDAGVTAGKMDGKRVVFEVGSGHYTFRLTGE